MHRFPIRLATLFLVGSWTWGASWAASPPGDPSIHSDGWIPRSSIPVEIYRGFLVVAEGHFGGDSPGLNFVIDTGTSPSILNIKVARRLGLPLSRARMSAVGGLSETFAATIPEIRFGPLRAISVPVLVSDLSRVERDLKLPIAGILGFDILGKSSFRLDYGRKLIEFGEVAPEGIPIELSIRAGLPIAETEVGGKSLRLLVDSGTNRMVIFGARSAAESSHNPAGSLTQETGVANLAETSGVSFVEFELSGVRFRQSAYIVSNGEEPLFDGLLGVRSLGVRVLSLDANRHILYLLK